MMSDLSYQSNQLRAPSASMIMIHWSSHVPLDRTVKFRWILRCQSLRALEPKLPVRIDSAQDTPRWPTFKGVILHKHSLWMGVVVFSTNCLSAS